MKTINITASRHAVFYSPQADYTKELLEKSKEINLDEQQKYSETKDASIKPALWYAKSDGVVTVNNF